MKSALLAALLAAVPAFSQTSTHTLDSTELQISNLTMQYDALVARRQALLAKPQLTTSDQFELQSLSSQINNIQHQLDALRAQSPALPPKPAAQDYYFKYGPKLMRLRADADASPLVAARKTAVLAAIDAASASLKSGSPAYPKSDAAAASVVNAIDKQVRDELAPLLTDLGEIKTLSMAISAHLSKIRSAPGERQFQSILAAIPCLFINPQLVCRQGFTKAAGDAAVRDLTALKGKLGK